MSKKSVSVIVAVLVWNCVSFAQNHANPIVNFQSEISQFSALCQEENCQKPFSRSEIYNQSEDQNINPELKKILQRISFKQAQVWGDTILEGDYAAAGNTRLDRVFNLFKNEEHIGYLITYSERAWDTSNCLYDGIHDATLLSCTEGRITESSYVSLNFKEYFYDDKTMAKFK